MSAWWASLTDKQTVNVVIGSVLALVIIGIVTTPIARIRFWIKRR